MILNEHCRNISHDDDICVDAQILCLTEFTVLNTYELNALYSSMYRVSQKSIPYDFWRYFRLGWVFLHKIL